MPHGACVLFVVRSLVGESSKGIGLKALEVGAWDPNGGFRALTDLHGGFAKYIGVDIREGPGIDVVCDAQSLVERFGEEAFDVVIAAELLEHVTDWRTVISNLKNVCKPGGMIIITTRSRGYRYHAAPYDFWRFEIEDMETIFSDCEILDIERDPEEPGVFVSARKPLDFQEKDLSGIALYCLHANHRELELDLAGARRARLFLTIAVAKLRQFGGLIFSPSKRDFRLALRLQANEIANLIAMLKGRGPSRF